MKVIACAFFSTCVFVGCTAPIDKSDSFGCIYAYDDSYMCYERISVDAEPVYKTKNVKECSRFVRNLKDGVYWLKGIDESGKDFAVRELVGNEGWRADGIVEVGGYLYDEEESSAWDRSVCALEEVSPDSIWGNCVKYYMFKNNCSGTQSFECTKDRGCSSMTCSFSFPVGKSDSSDVSAAIHCLRPNLWFVRSNPEDSVFVEVSDSSVVVSVPNATVTWTKRPGL